MFYLQEDFYEMKSLENRELKESLHIMSKQREKISRKINKTNFKINMKSLTIIFRR